MNDQTAAEGDLTLTADLGDWLAELRQWTKRHSIDAIGFGRCACTDHTADLDDLMARKHALLERCLTAEAARATEPNAAARGRHPLATTNTP